MQQKRLNWCEKHCIGFVPTCFHFAGSIGVAIQKENTITRMCEIEHERYTTEKGKKAWRKKNPDVKQTNGLCLNGKPRTILLVCRLVPNVCDTFDCKHWKLLFKRSCSGTLNMSAVRQDASIASKKPKDWENKRSKTEKKKNRLLCNYFVVFTWITTSSSLIFSIFNVLRWIFLTHSCTFVRGSGGVNVY